MVLDIVDLQSNKSYEHCIDSEKKAREILPQLIDAMPVEDVNNCVSKTFKNNSGPYVELAVYIDLNSSFGLGKIHYHPTSADLSEHARGGTISESEGPQTVVPLY